MQKEQLHTIMKETPKEELNLEQNGTNGKTANHDELIKIEHIEGTPFSSVKYQDKYFVAIGNYRVSELYKEKEYAEAWINNITWEKITQLIYAMIDNYENKIKTK